MDGVTIQIFGSKSCEECSSLIKAFEHHSIHFEFIDADAPENEKLCDSYNVDQLPHIQAVYNDNKKVFHTYIGYISPLVFVEKMKEHSSLLEEFFKVNKAIAQQRVDMAQIKKATNESASRPCGTCAKKNRSK